MTEQDPPRPSWAADGQLPAAVPGLVQTRTDLHRLAYAVLAVSRHGSTGRFGLRASQGGFGTPLFDGRFVRVVGTELVDDAESGERRIPLTTLRAAVDFVGVTPSFEPAAEHDSPPLGDVDLQLDIDEVRALFFANWFAFGWTLLETLRGDESLLDVGVTQLWPGHFDPAVEIGSAELTQRATYGASPGDGGHDEPYLYVGAWGDVDRSNSYWNETAFNGASLGYDELVKTSRPFEVALEFFQHGAQLLAG